MKTKKHGKKIIILTLLLMLIGIIMVASSSWPDSIEKYGNMFHYTFKQVLAAFIGIISLFLTIKIPFKIYEKYAVLLFLATLLLSILPFIPGIGMSINHSSRWINLRVTTIMPSDFLKIGAVILTAKYLSRLKNDDICKFNLSIIPMFIILAFSTILILKQPDLSTAMVLAASIIAMFIVAGLPGFYIFITSVIGFSCVLFFIFFKKSGYSRISRLIGFINPLQNKTGAGWQISQSLYAVAMGKFTGVGLGNSNQKFMYLSQAHNDYIYAIICEELGFIGAFLILILFLALSYEGIKVALSTEDPFGYYLAVGITFLITIQAFVNIAVALSLVPATGLTLPFISYGGSSLIAYFIMIGILINISNSSI